MTPFDLGESMTDSPGAWPVVLTPFTDADAVDLAALDRYVDWLLAHDAAGLFAVALSGEMYELSPSERITVAARVAARVAGRVPVAATAVGDADIPSATPHASTTASLIDDARALATAGADIVVLIAATLAGDGEPEVTAVQRALAVADALPGVAFGIYECPLPYHRVLSDEAVAVLAGSGRFRFFKETSHDVERMSRRVSDAAGTPLRVYNAGIENYAESLQVGVAGLSGWVVNVAPDLVARLGRLATAEGLSARVLGLQAALVDVEARMGPTYPASAKALVERRAGLGWTPRSRWRASDVDAELVAELANLLDRAATAVDA
jgi:4-hydroxy-tetrahydrodipicolinate synthase